MKNQNGYSLIAGRAISRVRQIVDDVMNRESAPEVKDRLLEELKFHKNTLDLAFEFRKSHGPEKSVADTDVYFREKLGSMLSFAEMAIDPNMHGGGYSKEKISDNVSHYSHSVAKLVVADWISQSMRPVSDISIKDSSFENRDALKRLVSR